MFKKLREENRDDWEAVVEKGKKEERNEESLPLCDYFMHSSIERERRLLDEKRVKWLARRMEMITKETKERFQGKMGVEYRVNKQAVRKKPATKSPMEIELMLDSEQYLMELLLLTEVTEWEQLFWNKFKAFLAQIGDDRVEEKERLTREWRANSWKRLNRQKHAALNRAADIMSPKDKDSFLENFGERWASAIRRLFEGVDSENLNSISVLKTEIRQVKYDEIRLRMEKELEDTEFRLKRGSDLGRFDQFWDDDSLFRCRYSPSKWLYLRQHVTVPLEIYSHALKGNKNIIHIAFSRFDPDSDVDRFRAPICDLPWVTSISLGWPRRLPAIHRDVLFIKSTTRNNDLLRFANEIRPNLDRFSTYIFTDAEGSDIRYTDQIGVNASVLISFVGPESRQGLILRLKHSGSEDGPLEVTLGSTIITLNPSFESPLTVDDIILYPTHLEVPRPSKSDHLPFEPRIRNDITIQFRGRVEEHDHFLHDIELLQDGLEYRPYSASLLE